LGHIPKSCGIGRREPPQIHTEGAVVAACRLSERKNAYKKIQYETARIIGKRLHRNMLRHNGFLNTAYFG
jgi:hypothetical protein